jgi:integrase/recombinase XerD
MKNHVVAVNQRDESPLAALLEKHLEDLRVRNYSEYTVKNRRVHIGLFLDWCRERGIREPVEVTRTVLESYQRHVFYYRKKSGEPLAFTGAAALHFAQSGE